MLQHCIKLVAVMLTGTFIPEERNCLTPLADGQGNFQCSECIEKISTDIRFREKGLPASSGVILAELSMELLPEKDF